MVDFLAYVVAELKSKRLSRPNAVELVRQFSGRGGPYPASTILHPLLHRNTSDLSGQRYTSVFTGEEFFLVDHQVKVDGDGLRKILPGAVYLEMARAAVCAAWPDRQGTAVCELRDCVWTQPLIVAADTEVSIALWANQGAQISYEIYTQSGGEQIIHCQGVAVWSAVPAPARLDLERLRKDMSPVRLMAESVYATFAGMGMIYGPGFQAISTIDQKHGQALAHLRLPDVVAGSSEDYVLHPSLVDSALQACVALADTAFEASSRPRVPYALESLRVHAPCQREMVSWLRHTADSQPQDDIVKVDIDVCDQQGNICIAMKAFSYRVLQTGQKAQPGLRSFIPLWKPVEPRTRPIAESTKVLLLGGSELALPWVQQTHRNASFAPLPPDATFDHMLWVAPNAISKDTPGILEQQHVGVLALFRITKVLLRLGYADRELRWTVLTARTQRVEPGDEVQPAHGAIFGLLGSLAKEYPQWDITLLDVDSLQSLTAHACLSLTPDKKGNGLAYRRGAWFHQQFSPLPLPPAGPQIHYRRQGVYVVLGGAGGLGEAWTRFMVEHHQAHVVWIGRRPCDASIENKIRSVALLGPAPLYVAADATKLDELELACQLVLQKYPAIHGVVHSAVVLEDRTLALMEETQFRAGLSAKVDTTVHMDTVFGSQALDFMLLFSSVVSFVKSPGQSNYAAGCTFQDSFAENVRQRRPFPVKVMHWGYWGNVGGAVDAYHRQTMEKMGIGSIEADEGMASLQALVDSGWEQMATIKMIGAHPIPYLDLLPEPPPPVPVLEDALSLREKGVSYFQRLIASNLKMRPEQIETHRPLADYGLDSILVGQLTYQLRKAFSGISATLLFEVKTVESLVDYLLANKKPELSALLSPPGSAKPSAAPSQKTRTPRVRPQKAAPSPAANRSIDVAVIGLHGRYPQADNLQQMWTNLAQGVNCVTQIPSDRWRWEDHYDPEKGKTGKSYTKWGGFLDGIDLFDPLFFKISPKEAKRMDPQERVFLESCYHAIEDAGYTPESLAAGEKIGVFVGVMNSRYAAQPSHFSVANRVSFLFNFQGPSMAVDTACSSSLTAVHLALESIYRGESVCAIAGGVNLIIDPVHYFQLTEMTMLSRGNECKAFGLADGVVDAEGVGAVLLKPLAQAELDGDHIYAVIKGSAINAGGKTNGYTVPSPVAQARLVSEALERAGILAEHVSYIEAHGTGTPLGDPIEIAALTRAFEQTSERKQFCAIGSFKSNIGHCESAAGIAGLTKVLLQLQHQQLAPSLHAEIANPEIDFSQTPFRVQKNLEPWPRSAKDGTGREIPRIAGVSSFGAGGANAHLIVQEYLPPAETNRTALAEQPNTVILFSARSEEQLKQRALDLLHFLRQPESWPLPAGETLDLSSIAYTLQVGREAMDERLGLLVSSVEELQTKLQAYVNGEPLVDAYTGQAKRRHDSFSLFSSDADLQQMVDRWLAGGKFSKLLELWSKGVDIDWTRLPRATRPKRVSLPLYPFARERYWTDSTASHSGTRATESTALHPLLHRNTSDLSEQRYSSTFAGVEPFLIDHQLMLAGDADQAVLPAVVYLEMARAAMQQACRGGRTAGWLELRHVVWVQPLVVTGRHEVSIALSPGTNDEVEFEIYSEQAGEELVHCQGIATWSPPTAPVRLPLGQLQDAMRQGELARDTVYAEWARMGVNYGPTFQAVTTLHRGHHEVLSRLRLTPMAGEKPGEYVLHPSVMDGALQSAIGLVDRLCEVPPQPRAPFALDLLRLVSPCSDQMAAWVRYAPGSGAADTVVKLDIDLCDRDGNVCVQMQGLSSRALSKDNPVIIDKGTLLAVPVWQAAELAAPEVIAYTEHSILLCELPGIAGDAVVSLLPESQCLSLLVDDEENSAERYSRHAVACFKRIQTILQSKPQGKVLFQMAVGGESEQHLLAGLWAMLRTATLENPQLIGQLILVPAAVTAPDLARYLEAESTQPSGKLVKYEHAARHVLHWQELPAGSTEAPVAFKNDGVYLITGGLGGLGMLFAREAVRQAPACTVVLTGRSPLNAERQRLLDSIPGGRLRYLQADVADSGQVDQLIAAITVEYGRLNGVLHGAGLVADSFILKKPVAEFTRVLSPKVTGTYNLDCATMALELDFFVLFSSISGAVGNVGQCDYAAANGFMDHFAAHRNLLVASKQRHGLTRSIDWGAWQAGMGNDAAALAILEETSGMLALESASGIEAFYRSLALPNHQVLVAAGDLARLRQALVSGRATPLAAPTKKAVSVTAIDADTLSAKANDYLRREFAELLQLSPHKIDPYAPLEDYGIDSILAMKLTNKLETTFGSLAKTLLFEYQTIAALAGYLLQAHPDRMRQQIGFQSSTPAQKETIAPTGTAPNSGPARKHRKRVAAPDVPNTVVDLQEVAIVGLAGRYPQADDLSQFWKNLQQGRDCITEIPAERWDFNQYYDPDPNRAGKTNCKWGGFLADVDKFDPLFFNISPREAALLDPQERLFLETVWETLEDAGYTRQSMAGSRVGVFVGVMWGHYELLALDSAAKDNPLIPSSSYASIANRVSYFFDFHGPSMALDTMCSSSLTAIDLACERLRRGEIDAAIAGGVNVTLHPNKYLALGQGKFGASDGKCRSFGAGGDGYVPGEGVGAVLLKPLQAALRDGDQIYAIVKSSALNHGGKTNGYTVPNPKAQGDLVLDALHKATVDPGTLGYIETHGTGTSLGDPIEIAGLSKAFGPTTKKQFCPIGSVKSNIGHLESAAGIAAVTKALLQIRYKQLVPSLHAEPANPHIDFKDSPFYVQTALAEWKHTAAHPRLVGVSSFGAGGSNAHLLLEEYPDVRPGANAPEDGQPEVFLLSARDWTALRRYAAKVTHFLEGASGLSLSRLAYTSQVGRTAMDARLAVIASNVGDLKAKLHHWLALDGNLEFPPDGAIPDLTDVVHGNLKEAHFNHGGLMDGQAGLAFLAGLMANHELDRLARLWTLGVVLDWSLLRRAVAPIRTSLPTYPFAKERCWITTNEPVTARRVAEPVEEKQRTYYYPLWTQSPLGLSADARTASIIILDTNDSLFLAMKQASGEQAEPIILVKPGLSFEELEPHIFTIDPEREEHYHELLQNLRSKGLLPEVVLHYSAGMCNLDLAEQVAQQLTWGIYQLTFLLQALIKQKHQRLRVLSVFSSTKEAGAPLSAAMSGFFRTVALEKPRYLAKVVEVENGALSLAETVALIRKEMNEPAWSTPEIRYRRHAKDGQPGITRSTRALALQLPPKTPLSPLPLRRNGVYLITGGLGGLGLIFAEYLATHYQAKLILLGRSVPSLSRQEALNRLNTGGAEVLVLQADVSSSDDMQRVVKQAKDRFSRIDGVIHAAGVNRDSLLLHKTKLEMDAVLAPKVWGAIALDRATSAEPLDFFILFSSIAGVLGNHGQSSYAYANAFLDSFAESREQQRTAEHRSGRTLSIDWPLWQEGGMGISPEQARLLEQTTGLHAMPAQEGIRYFEDFLRSEARQGIAFYGVASKIATAIARPSAKPVSPVTAAPAGMDRAEMLAKTETHLKALIAEEIKLDPSRIGSFDRLESFGIDSVIIHHLNANLERDFGALPKTLFYQHETVRDLAQFLLQDAWEALVKLFGAASVAGDREIESTMVTHKDPGQNDPPPEAKQDAGLIAIVGMHGMYPHSANLAEYWENLQQGKDLVDLVPAARWNYREFYHPDPAAAADGKMYCKWGGFLEDYDKFDPHFFMISPEEASLMDPQERLFLQSVWAALEDAGYTRDRLRETSPKAKSADVGVFVGVTSNTYHLWAPEQSGHGSPNALPWSIANRVSYFFNFNGPSMPIDTACSSSLVAVHLACESLRNQDCQVAIAGGVNLYLHPAKYLSLCQRRMLSLDGKCHSYGAGEDGFVPGEGVGTLILKTLIKAEADHDHIYAVIPASAYEHSGRSNGYSAPNPNSQASLIGRALSRGHIPAETIGYVEGHGTGTRLGDGLEIAALTQAFQTRKKQFCALGSVKANIGHAESAAGMAGMAKVILQLQHETLLPSLHSDVVNPDIDFAQSPFYLQHGLSAWGSSPAHPRRALVNAFGAGGVNACVVLEQYQGSKPYRSQPDAYVFVLSARNEDRLREYVERLLAHLRRHPDTDLAGLCYTLQFGREAMEERMAMVVANTGELVQQLDEWSRQGASQNAHRGSVRGPRRTASVAGQSLAEMASMWVAGEPVEWDALYPGARPRSVPLPTYPFARERYWFATATVAAKPSPVLHQLHPLLSRNSSTLKEVSFSSVLSDTAFYALDHTIQGVGVFPGACYLEMACIAGSMAAERRVRKIADVVWIRPLSFQNGPRTVRTSLKHVGEFVDYSMASLNEESEMLLHAEGRLIFAAGSSTPVDAGPNFAIEELKALCGRREAGEDFYRRYRAYGLDYGPAFQVIQELYTSDSFALSKLKIPSFLRKDFGQYILHPSLMDGALQTVAGLVGGLDAATPNLPFALDEVDILHPLRQTCYAYVAFASAHEPNQTGVKKFHIQLLNESGDVLMTFKNLFVRPLAMPEPSALADNHHPMRTIP